MPRLSLGLIIAMTVVGTPPTLGCTPAISKSWVYFDFNSAELSSDALGTIWRAGAGRNLQRLPAACESFVVVGHVDTAESLLPGTRLDIARADAVRRALAARGSRVFQVEGRSSQQPGVVNGPKGSERANRRVDIKWIRETGGRLRCDPSTANDQTLPPTTCGIPEFAACYKELDDGTICNFDDVPDPNPERYSVIR